MRDILTSLRSRPAKGHARRIGSASRFLKRLSGSLGDARLAEHLKVDPAELAAAIKSKRNQLTWFDPDTATPAATWTPDGDKVKATGVALLKDGTENYKLESGSLMDFDCVITSARRDRDGDVLNPKGAVVDPKMPLLWQHVPFQPIGRMVRLLEQDESKLSGRFMIANTALGSDAAVLIEAGCLRISHGFAPIEYNPLKDDAGKDLGGWNITKYAMMEASAVSIPSNVDAEIEAFSRGKLHHPLVKGWCELLNAARKKSVKAFDSNGGKFEFTLNIAGLDGVVKAAGKPAKPADQPKKKGKGKADDDDDDEDDDEEEDDTDTDTEPAKTGDDDDADDDEEEDDDAAGKDDAPAGESGRALGELIDQVREVAKGNDLPKEAANRLGVVNGILEDIEGEMGAAFDTIADAAKGRDLVRMFTAMGELTTGCVGKLAAVSEEIDRIAGIAEIPDGVSSALADVKDDADRIVAAVGAISDTADAGDDADEDDDGTNPKSEEEEDDDADKDDEFGDDDEDDDAADKDDDADEDEDDEEDDDADKADDDDDEDKAGDGDDDEDDEEKADGTDGESVSPDDQNPGIDDDPNPGMDRGRKPGGKRRKPARVRCGGSTADTLVDEIVGKYLSGQKLTANERAIAKRAVAGGEPPRRRRTV